MKAILLDAIAFMLSLIILCIFIPFYLPCLIIMCIREAYAEDRENSRLHRHIEEFLSRQRDENDSHQINAW